MNKHFTNCSKANLPICSFEETCNLSCIIRWVSHLKSCDECMEHSKCLMCENNHCKKIRALYDLKIGIIQFMIKENIAIEDNIFDKLISQLNCLFSIDYWNVSYKGNDKNTLRLFTLLEIFLVFSAQMISLSFSMNGEELTYCLNYIIRNELI